MLVRLVLGVAVLGQRNHTPTYSSEEFSLPKETGATEVDMVSELSTTQRGITTDGVSTWQVFRFLKTRHFGTRLFWYPFGCLVCRDLKVLKTDGVSKSKF